MGRKKVWKTEELNGKSGWMKELIDDKSDARVKGCRENRIKGYRGDRGG